MRLFVACVFVLACYILPAWAADAGQPRTAKLEAMGGIPISVSAWGLTKAQFNQAVQDIKDCINLEESQLSTYQPNSAVTRLNRGETLAETPPSLTTVVRKALEIGKMTGGAFDITVQPLIAMWRQCRQEQRLPGAEECRAALAKVGYQRVRVLADGSIKLEPGMQIDLGGIAKGYFSSLAVDILRKAGASRCLVAVAGDIVAWQELPAQQPFRVGVRDPLGSDGLLAVLEIPAGAVTTSGNYERFYEIDGHRYCHIFNPHTGQPVEGMLSVTLLAPTGIEADALATSVFVMGLEQGRRFVEAHEGLEAVIVASNGQGGMQVYVSPGLVDRIEFVKKQ
jgi:FAD:protein FMN transferase